MERTPDYIGVLSEHLAPEELGKAKPPVVKNKPSGVSVNYMSATTSRM